MKLDTVVKKFLSLKEELIDTYSACTVDMTVENIKAYATVLNRIADFANSTLNMDLPKVPQILFNKTMAVNDLFKLVWAVSVLQRDSVTQVSSYLSDKDEITPN